MDSVLPRELPIEELVDHAMPFDEGQFCEFVGGDDDAEMGLGRRAIGHGRVMRVQVGVVVDLETGGAEVLGELDSAVSVRHTGNIQREGTKSSPAVVSTARPDRRSPSRWTWVVTCSRAVVGVIGIWGQKKQHARSLVRIAATWGPGGESSQEDEGKLDDKGTISAMLSFVFVGKLFSFPSLLRFSLQICTSDVRFTRAGPDCMGDCRTDSASDPRR